MSGPLEGVRILDLTMWWSGPAATALLGGLGADVIKVESIQHPDYLRLQVSDPRAMTGEWWENGPIWISLNMNKRDITLDLSNEEGRELFLGIAKESDVVIENYAPRVMGNFGLSYDTLKKVNPGLIMVSMSCFGATGSWRDFVGFALVFEQMAGVAQLTGYPDLPPSVIGGAADPFASLYAIFVIMVALEHRRQTGEGQYIDMSQTETMAQTMGPEVLDFVFNKRLGERRGSKHERFAPYGCYPCAGEEEWLAIAVTDDDEWRALVRAMEDPAWALEERFADFPGRLRNQSDLDRFISQWTCQRDKIQLMKELQAVGVPAGAVLRSTDLVSNPHLEARGFHQEVTREGLGTYRFPLWALKFSDYTCGIAMPAPRLGQHNREILCGLLGLSEGDIARLEKHMVIGTRPLGV